MSPSEEAANIAFHRWIRTIQTSGKSHAELALEAWLAGIEWAAAPIHHPPKRTSADAALIADLESIDSGRSEWEVRFIESTAEQLAANGRGLSARQREVAERILARYT